VTESVKTLVAVRDALVLTCPSLTKVSVRRRYHAYAAAHVSAELLNAARERAELPSTTCVSAELVDRFVRSRHTRM